MIINICITIKAYYGGGKIDSIPAISFNPPQGAIGLGGIHILKDFNGDGRNELAIYYVNFPFSEKQYGTLYFYNTESRFDTIPHYILTGDSVKKISIGFSSSGDINGDGKADFTISGSIGEDTSYRYFRSFYIGNENFDLQSAVTYYRDEHAFDPQHMKIINDINNDGEDDILINNYANYYPFYYANAILYGSFPIDTIPDAGLNTQNEGLYFDQTFSLGDVNGDGYDDFFSQTVVFGYSNIKLWLGGKNMPGTLDDVANKTWYGTSTGFGRILSNVGDVDGDGVNDIAIGQILYGAAPDDNCNTGWIYIIRGDTSVVTSVKDKEPEIPGQFKIEEPYPNPFNPVTTIKYTIGITAKVKIKLFDTLGREIKTLLNEEKKEGKYQTEINIKELSVRGGLSSGTYFVQFQFTTGTGRSYQETKKIILIK